METVIKWKSSTEEPKYSRQIITLKFWNYPDPKTGEVVPGVKPHIIALKTLTDNPWPNVVDMEQIQTWCYLDDLLPTELSQPETPKTPDRDDIRRNALKKINKNLDSKGAIACTKCGGFLHFEKTPFIRFWCDSCGFIGEEQPTDYNIGGVLYRQSAGHFGPSDD